MPARVRALEAGDAPACDAIIAGLRDWFGLEQGVAQCALAVRRQAGVVSLADGGSVAGFATLVRHFPETYEISWMAVARELRGRGHGRALVEAAAAHAAAGGASLLVVKTLSARHPSQEYAQTRAFYRACGFLPAQELDIWGPENPCLLLVRPLAG